MSSPISREDQVRHFLELKWPNWRIARELHVSKTTVQRERTKIQTGPNPVILAEPAADGDRPARQIVNPAVLLAVALTAAAVIAAGMVWARVLSPSAPAPQYTLCVQVSPAGAVSGLAGGSDGTCPLRWTAVILAPGH